DYVRYRPGYPPAIIPFLQQATGLNPAQGVADIGSGTGILTRLVLEQGNRVYGVEPNGPMREAASRYLKDFENFISIPGTAEQTGLEASSVDLILSGQAFHWFDPVRAKAEFKRIASPGAQAVLIWNERREDGPFHSAYNELLQRYATDYQRVNHKNIRATDLEKFFSPFRMGTAEFENAQDLGLDQLMGRLFSSSYMPTRADPSFPVLSAEVHRLFDRFAGPAGVRISYRTLLYYGLVRES
ncbi:MAG TPA: class I SAM-dependent methyltransferase, partial [Chitinophagaceae bacterium]|nr:class I SAM-dependent methyltransferase [Chitinophagaceae bacterium]